ncbi:DDHD domain-containing protein [Fimicolochytrium jonesii]|uniref:DDHD domain-containing protein n=1 Tax=Fimicolochytrium jonesii TaxID=1396493 RepID=UPI0022FF0835|nr:DDHD domain-containing protein [Fimicolochytrium jonesii]KAI8818709.1 DDHD domain-containing protein [Fimicolochytrium jonesii]
MSTHVHSPPLKVRWFHAVDVPKRDDSPFRVASAATTQKVPATWKAFSEKDSAKLEVAYRKTKPQRKRRLAASGDEKNAITLGPDGMVPVNEDQLFEADIEKMETYPVYWNGPAYDIRRGTWFYAAFGGNYIPCDENLSRQAEDGYMKFQPWLSGQTSGSAASPGQFPTKPPTTEQRWALLGPYMNQFIVYDGAHSATQFSDDFGSKIGRAVMNIGGTRLIRGWDEVEKLRTKTKAQAAEEKKKENQKAKETGDGKPTGKSEAAPSPQTDSALSAANGVSLSSLISDIAPGSSTGTLTREQAENLQEKQETEDYKETDDEDRTINHLVLVIHGIGQKLGERVEAVNFVHDCNLLRRTIKNASQQYATAKDQLKQSKRAGLISIPDDGGVQILPVQWRQKIQFGLARKEKPPRDQNAEGAADDEKDVETVLEDITLDGVPGIRQLVSDVVLDVLLYMTPRYRQEMIQHVTEELNRIYHLFIQRNPKFNGKVSIVGHSLGSLLSFDILCNQAQNPIQQASADAPSSPRKATEVDLTEFLHRASDGETKDTKVKGMMERPSMTYGHLDFTVDRLFVVGSPVGLFLLLKGEKLQAFDNSTPSLAGDGIARPAVKALYNIFHPHDPVAYRIEPVINRDLALLKPVPIPYTKGGLKGTIVGIQDLGTGIADRGRSMFEAARAGLTSTTAGITSGFTAHVGRVVTMVNAFKAPAYTAEASSASSDIKAELHGAGLASSGSNLNSNDSLPATAPASSVEMHEIVRPSPENATDVELLNPRGRIDYVLQEGVLENPYISALGVHMNYWSDPDSALFILRELYCEVSGDSAWREIVSGGSSGEGASGSGKGRQGGSSDREINQRRGDKGTGGSSLDGSLSGDIKAKGLSQMVYDSAVSLQSYLPTDFPDFSTFSEPFAAQIPPTLLDEIAAMNAFSIL